MAFTLKDGQGSLFHNDKRKEGSQQPDKTGSIRIDGKEYWLSGWTKAGAKGEWVSLSATPKEDRPPIPPNDARPWGQKLDDSIQ